MAKPAESPALLLENSLRSERIHSAYLISGAGDAPLSAALSFARGLVCESDPAEPRPCEACPACRRSQPAEEPIPLAAGDTKGPRFRQIGELRFVELHTLRLNAPPIVLERTRIDGFHRCAGCDGFDIGLRMLECRTPVAPIRCALISVTDVQHGRFIEGASNDLHRQG